MSKYAWVTLATNDSYSLGALVLAHSLKRVSTAHQLAILVTPTVSESMRSKLKDVFNVVQEVNVLDSQDAANLALLARPELGITFTKIHCWRLIQFEKCVFLDADTLVLKNCDELFERDEFSAAPDVGWPDCFNSGVFVYRPCLDTYTKITQFALDKGSFDGGDQGLLNLYFADWATSDSSKRLPFFYNTCSTATYSYLPAFKQFADRIKILHFIGQLKPWLLNFNSQNKTVYTPNEYGHLHAYLQFWWDLFCDSVHTRLTDEMCFSSYQIQNASNQSSYVSVAIRDELQTEVAFNVIIHDPWEDYYENLEKTLVSNVVNTTNTVSQSEVKSNSNNINDNNNYLTNNQQVLSEDNVDQSNDNDNNTLITSYNIDTKLDLFVPDENSNPEFQAFQNPAECVNVELSFDNRTVENSRVNISASVDSNRDCIQNIHDDVELKTNNVNIELLLTSKLIDNKISNSILHTDSNVLADIDSDDEEGGLAGALAKLRLGEPRTVEQEAYEQHMRRQCWEQGNIDYSGRDSFDNIWRKITETMSSAEPKPDEKPGTRLTSADIQDGKVVVDKKTGAKTTYKKLTSPKKGYSVTIETPQPNGTMKSETQTYYDPVPMTQEEMEAARKAQSQNKGNTNQVVKKIPGGKEIITTIVNADGTQTMQVQTIYDSEEEEITEETHTEIVSPKKTTKTVAKKTSDPSSISKKIVQQDSTTTEEVSVKSKRTVEETRSFSETTEVTGKSTKTTKKNQAIEQKSVQAIEDKSEKPKKKQGKLVKVPLPDDFVEKEGEQTTLEKRRVHGGTEYIYTTVMTDGRTRIERKTVEEEQGVEMTEEEIEEYHQQLKEAEKYKNVKKNKKITTEHGTKTVVPSENAGEVTTVQTIKIEGGTEYHYTTIRPDGTVKKSSKTIYDPVPVPGDEDEFEEIEEYEEEIIEPGEPIVETIEITKTVTASEKKKLEMVVSASNEAAPKKKSGKKSAAK